MEKLYIASCRNLEYGDVFVGYYKRDEEFVKEGGGYLLNDGNPLNGVAEVEATYPPGCTAIHFAEDDVHNDFGFL